MHPARHAARRCAPHGVLTAYGVGVAAVSVHERKEIDLGGVMHGARQARRKQRVQVLAGGSAVEALPLPCNTHVQQVWSRQAVERLPTRIIPCNPP